MAKKTVIWNGDQATTYVDGKPRQTESGRPATPYLPDGGELRPLRGTIKWAAVGGVRLSGASLKAITAGDEAIIRRLGDMESAIANALRHADKNGMGEWPAFKTLRKVVKG